MTGVVVEEVGEGSALARAGIQAGDVLLSWERLSHPPANPEEAQGNIQSVFEWMWLKIEQAPRGTVRLVGNRGGKPMIFEVAMGLWDVKVRPQMPRALLETYLQGKDLIEAEQLKEGIGRWQKAAGLAKEKGHWGIRCWLSLHIGKAWAEARNWEEAHASYQAALEDARDPISRVVAWDALGKHHEQLSDLEKAEASYRSALKLREAAWGESLSVAQNRRRLGKLSFDRGNWKLATEYFQQSLAAREELAPNSLAVADSQVTLGIMARNYGDLDLADELYRRSLTIQEKLAPNGLAVALTLSSLGIVAWDRSDLEAAAEYHRRSLRLRQKASPNSILVAASLTNLGIVAFDRGQLEQALDFYEKALDIYGNLLPNSLLEANVLNNMAAVLSERGEFTIATDYFQRVLTIEEALSPDSPAVAATLNNLGNVAFQSGDLDMAAGYLQRSLEIKEVVVPESPGLARTMENIGKVTFLRGDLETAEKYHRRALNIQQEASPGSLAVAEILNSLGGLELERGMLRHAKSYYHEALAIREKLVPASLWEAETLEGLANVAQRENRLDVAADYFNRSLEALEAQINRVGGSQDIKGGFRALKGGVYLDAALLEMELGHPQKAFHILERYRGQSFLALLAERDLVFSADIPEDLEVARRRIAARHDRLVQELTELSPEEDEVRIDALKTEQRKLRQDRDDIIAKIRQAYPHLAALQYPRSLDLQGVREVLDPGTLMLSYNVGKSETYLFAVTRNSELSVMTLAVGEETLRNEVQDLRTWIQDAKPGSELGTRSMESFLAAAKRLYVTLIEPVADRVERSQRLLIIPDGPLHVLPFSALIRETDGEGTNSGTGVQYLIEWKPIHFALSGTVYAELKRARPEPTELDPLVRLVAFGDPHFPSQLTKEGSESIANPQVRSVARRGFEFEPLPATRLEVERIAGLFPEGATTHLDREATEARAKSLGSGLRYIHFATHGILDKRLPLNSALVLTIPEEFREDRDNGLLQAWEIFERVRIDADLVVLSACESGLGQEVAGEGLIGLTRAFHYAGARSVVPSLWEVADRTTAELMFHFYRHLKEGKPKDEALRAAQIELIWSPIRAEDEQGQLVGHDASVPYYWAAFQLMGDWQ